MKILAIGALASLALLLGCSDENPVASEPAPKLTVSGTVAATCELPPCNPGFGGSGGNAVPATPTPDPDPEPEEPASEATFELPNGATMEFVWIEPGTFTMGSPESEISALNAAWDTDTFSRWGPQHEVTISEGFWLGKYEITQGQWEAVVGTTPWSGKDYVQSNPQHPAVYISWDDVQGMIAQLNAEEGAQVYRLPTEAEWEYACRAGTTTPWSFGADEGQLGDYAWYSSNAWFAGLQYAQPVGTKLANPWGLFDVHGNAMEWVEDWYGEYASGAQTDPPGPSTGPDRAFRGGSFSSHAYAPRSAYRFNNSSGYRYCLGARLSRTQ